MNIRAFKEGDIITRCAPVVYAHNDVKDSSYCGDRIIFVGYDETSKTIVFTSNKLFQDTPLELSYAREAWDEGWAFFPETLWQKALKLLSATNN